MNCITKNLDEPTYRAGCAGAPPPLHVTAHNGGARWFPLGRPTRATGEPGPRRVGSQGPVDVGMDPTDPATHRRPYRPMAGMQARFNLPTDGVL